MGEEREKMIKDGWVIVSEDPFKVERDDGSSATGFAATLVEDAYVERNQVYCDYCGKTISATDLNEHFFMSIKGGGLIHWNCENK